MTGQIIAIIILILFSAYFSATETAFTSINRIKLKTQAGDGDDKAQKVLDLAEKYDKLLTTILIGNNVVNITMTAIATVLFVGLLAHHGATVSTIVITVVVLIFGEITCDNSIKEIDMKRLFTSESVTEGHPDKICDQISDAIVDAILAKDPLGRVAAETTVNTGYAMVMGEITTECYVDIPKIARKVIVDIGYDRAKYGFDGYSCAIMTSIDEQSPDIAQGVDEETNAEHDIGAEKALPCGCCGGQAEDGAAQKCSFAECLKALAADINVCSQKGLSEKFDSTIGAGTVVMPFGGQYQMTPAQSMVQKISVEDAVSDTCSIMAWGYDPYISEKSPYHGAYLAVVDSVAKLIAAGGGREATYLSFQEYFERLGRDPERWGKPLAALLGAFEAQMGLEVAAIGGKDSMSGSFEDIDVPPTLVSFAVTTAGVDDIITNEFKGKGHKVVLLTPEKRREMTQRQPCAA